MALPQQKRKKIGEMLIAEGLLTPEQLETALEEQHRHGGRIGAILKSLGFVTEEGMIKTLGRQTGIPHQVLSTVIIDPDAVKLVPGRGASPPGPEPVEGCRRVGSRALLRQVRE